jgi:hypothetical protein
MHANMEMKAYATQLNHLMDNDTIIINAGLNMKIKLNKLETNPIHNIKNINSTHP